MKVRQSHSTWKPVLPVSSLRERKRHLGIYSERELRELILHEKQRADRVGGPLSLIVFDYRPVPKAGRAVRGMVQRLSHAVRSTDHLGWFGKRQIGVVLSATDKRGAGQFLEQFESTLTSNGFALSVYSYPEQWSSVLDTGPSGGCREADQEPDDREKDDDNGRHEQDSDLYYPCSDTAESQPETDLARRLLRAVRRTEARYRRPFERAVPLWKRSLDLFAAGLGLVILTPLFVVLGVYIKLVSPGPVLFRQTRIGRGKTEFQFLKFRTMHHRNEVTTHSHHLKDLIHSDRPMEKLDEYDPRIIPGGRILRKLAVDELPQIFNVLRGEMSLVGPRPCIPYEADEYERWHTHRFTILPGLTGLWQVSGKNKLTFAEMIRLDIAYERNMSLWIDLWIIVRTIPTVIGLGLEGAGNRLARLGIRPRTERESTKAKRSEA